MLVHEHILKAEIPYVSPFSLFALFHDQTGALLFHSALAHDVFGRYSYIAMEPFQTLVAKNGRIALDSAPLHGNPFLVLKTLLADYKQSTLVDLPPFQGGIAGAFSYDLYPYIESFSTDQSDNMQFPDLSVGFYDVVISFDHQALRAWIVSTGWPEKTIDKRISRAKQRLDHIRDFIANPPIINVDETALNLCKTDNIHSHFNEKTYADAVTRVIEHIKAGDVFEANISQCFTTQNPHLLPFDLYKRLMRQNPAPFAAYLNLGEFIVVSASPERFLKLKDGFVETRPIKGTRRRDPDPVVDRALADELVNSEKDRAENIMIVDLMRNDLSKVCREDSVMVGQLCQLETYPSVHHLVSVVTGELKPRFGAIDLLMATFPGGSITGAPKVRAMQIIASIEPTKRGIYCGSIGFIGFDGNLDLSIAIRTYTIKQDMITFQAGGAVVIDSNPQDEYQETLTKSHALHHALTHLDES
ncbi:MAG TPA: aminodeoxychorismate synthase component I [Legionella sp.]|nr:aminodeoxychorismate synthase component I [Legionella sp.]